MKRIIPGILLLAFGCRGTPPTKPTAPPPSEPAAQTEPASVQEPLAAATHYVNRATLEFPVDPKAVSGRKGLELWYRLDGGAWLNHGFVPSTAKETRFLAPRDGDYEFVFVPVDFTDRRLFVPDAQTSPDHKVVLDTTPPVVEVLTPNGGEAYGAGRSTVLQWTAADPHPRPDGVRIEVSTNGGESWIPVIGDLSNTGTFHWDIPRASSQSYRLRVSLTDLAGNTGRDESDGLFLVDGLAPEIRITGPDRATTVPVKMDYRVADLGGSEVRKVQLYVSRDRGLSWVLHGETLTPGEPVEFTDLDGVYGLMPVAEDRLGNASAIPAPGTPPPFVLTLDRTKPEVKIFEPKAGSAAVAGHEFPITWVAKDNLLMADNGITLEYSDNDGVTWTLIEDQVLNNGQYVRWTPPRRGGDRYRVRVRARDVLGNTAEAVSEAFGVDTMAPVGVITSVKPDHDVLRIEYRTLDSVFGKVDRVELWYSLEEDPQRRWYQYGTDPDADGIFPFRKPDGNYRLFIVVSNESARRTGIAQKPPQDGTAPEAAVKVVLDLTPPLALITFPKRETAFGSGTTQMIRWRYEDANPDPKGVVLYHSSDDGKNWTEIAGGLDPKLGEFPWVVPKIVGGIHLIKIEGRDVHGNLSAPDLSAPFRIDAEAPRVRVTVLPPRYVPARSVEIPYEATDDVGRVSEVAAWIRRKDEGTFRRVAESKEARGRLTIGFNDDGDYAVVLVCTDEAGKTSADPAKVEPDLWVGADTTKPEVRVLTYLGSDQKQHYVNERYEVAWTSFDNLTPSDDIRIDVQYTVDGMSQWYEAVTGGRNVGVLPMRSLFQSSRRYRIKVVATDLAGNRAETETGDFLPTDLPPAVLSLQGIQHGQDFAVGARATILWMSTDPGIQQATLQQCRGGGEFRTVAVLDKRPFPLTLPLEAGQYSVRVVGSDLLGKPVESNRVTFQMVPIDPSNVRIVTQFVEGSVLPPGSGWKVIWTPTSVTSAVKSAKLVIRKNNEDYQVIEVTGPHAVVSAPEEEGEYVLALVLETEEGRKVSSNPVRFLVTRDQPPPHLDLLSMRGGEFYAGGSDRIIGIRAEHIQDLSQVQVFWSDEGGKEGSWHRVPPSQLRAIEGGIYWRGLPSKRGDQYRLRLVYDHRGRRTVTESKQNFTIDTEPPVVRIVGPLVGRSPVRLELNSSSYSPVEGLTLWVSVDGGRTWPREWARSLDPANPIFQHDRQGEYGLFLAARNAAGLASTPPLPGTNPMITIRLGEPESPLPPGNIRLIVPLQKKVMKGGEKGDALTLKWETPGAPKDAVVVIGLVVDGEHRVPVLKDAAPSGEHVWQIPELNYKLCRLEALLQQKGVTLAAAASEPFAIDSKPPEVQKADIVEFSE